MGREKWCRVVATATARSIARAAAPVQSTSPMTREGGAAVAADRHRGRKDAHLPGARGGAVGVAQDRQRDRHASRMKRRIAASVSRKLTAITTRPSRLVALRQQFERRHFGAAGLAPAGPEVQQHDLAARGGEFPSGSALHGQRQQRRRPVRRPAAQLRAIVRMRSRDPGAHRRGDEVASIDAQSSTARSRNV